MFSYLKTMTKHSKDVIEKISVKKGIFTFLCTKIWAPIPVSRYENPSGYVIADMCSKIS